MLRNITLRIVEPKTEYFHFTVHYVHVSLMWIAMFTVNPIVFGFFFYACLKKTGCTPVDAIRTTNVTALQWTAFSFLLDVLLYVLIIPAVMHQEPNRTFFIDQSPWIWLNYLTMFVLGHISRYLYVKNYRYI